jgi:tetratricopeptide (TPR) repeat protein
MAKSSIILILFLLPHFVFAEQIKAPELTPALTNQYDQAIIDEGIALHDQGKYDEAVAKFKQVLEKSPGNVLAIYEMASSYFSAKKYEETLKTSYEGARYKSRYLSKFYLYIGNSLDELGKTDEAISAFRDALNVVSTDPLIHFNLAVILMNSGKRTEAQLHFEKAIELNPTHSSSHYALSQLYFEQGKRISGNLAVFRFLSLEPSSIRSRKAIEILLGAEQPVSDVFNAMAELRKNNEEEFAADHYLPYFDALRQNNFEKTFTHYIYQSVNAASSTWIEQHKDEVDAFEKWSKNYGQ